MPPPPATGLFRFTVMERTLLRVSERIERFAAAPAKVLTPSLPLRYGPRPSLDTPSGRSATTVGPMEFGPGRTQSSSVEAQELALAQNCESPPPLTLLATSGSPTA